MTRILGPFILYILATALVAILGLSGALWFQTQRFDAAMSDNAALALSLSACTARITNLTEDKETDDEVDRIPDDDLRNAPDSWLLPPGFGTIY